MGGEAGGLASRSSRFFIGGSGVIRRTTSMGLSMGIIVDYSLPVGLVPENPRHPYRLG